VRCDARGAGRSLDDRIGNCATNTKTHDPTFPPVCPIGVIPSIQSGLDVPSSSTSRGLLHGYRRRTV
jgi:hypothetical protein